MVVKSYNRRMETYCTIFLLNADKDRMLLLHRSEKKVFAPSLWTGLGGKIESDETVYEGTYRELREESGINNIELVEFSRCHVDGKRTLHYFAGVIDLEEPPECNEGTLYWKAFPDVIDIINFSTTKYIVEEWWRRQLHTDQPWTTVMKKAIPDDPTSTITQLTIVEGLHDPQ